MHKPSSKQTPAHLDPPPPPPPNKPQQRAELLADRSLAFLSLGEREASRQDAEEACLEDKFFAPAHFQRAMAYHASGKLELAQEAVMQALLLAPESEELFRKVQELTRDIGRTDFGVGPPNEQLHKEGSGAVIQWTEEEQPAQWYRKETVETMEKSLPYTALHALELAIHAHVLPEAVLKKTRLCIHLAGVTSELEGLSDFAILFEKLPQLEELEVVHVGYLGVFGPCKSIVPDPQAPPAGRLVRERRCLGNGRRLLTHRWKGMYHDFLGKASRHAFDRCGYLHEAPDLVLLANPGLDFFFDSWAPTIACLRDAGYLTVVTGGNLDHSRRHHNLILQALGVKLALRLRTSRFGILHARRACKNHNLCAFWGAAPLAPGKAAHPSSSEDFVAVRALLKRLGVELSKGARPQQLPPPRPRRDDLPTPPISPANAAIAAMAASKRFGFAEEGGRGMVRVGSKNNVDADGDCSNKDRTRPGQSKKGWDEEENAQADADDATNNSMSTPTSKSSGEGEAMAAGAGSVADSPSQGQGWSCRSFRKGKDGIYMVGDS